MARVPYVDKEEMPPQYRAFARSASNITRALSNSPLTMQQSGSAAKYIRDNQRLDPRLREMAIIQVGYSARSAYEYAHHVEIGLSSGVSEADIRAIADELAGRPTGLGPLDKAVLRAAREMTLDGLLSDTSFAALRNGLDNERLVDLVFAIANYNAVVLILESLKVDLEDEYRPYMERFPFPEK